MIFLIHEIADIGIVQEQVRENQWNGRCKMRFGILTSGLMLAGLMTCLLTLGSLDRHSEASNISSQLKIYSVGKGKYVMTEKVVKSEEEWKKSLTPEQFHILREKGTERAYSGKYWNNHERGIYRCAGCGLDLYNSDTKFESGTGWPSFTAPVAPENVMTRPDNSWFSHRTEVLCPRCGGHLGHVFDDGPKPTGLRYCMNSAALQFVATK
jgi:peptide-methionine (R)-S-oxide reductase